MPISSIVGCQVFDKSWLAASSDVGLAPSTNGYRSATLGPASAVASLAARSSGQSALRAARSRISPVASSSIATSSGAMMRNSTGPSPRRRRSGGPRTMSTGTSAIRPRRRRGPQSVVVVQPWSRGYDEARPPMRSARASTYAGRSGDPDSSLASISTTQRTVCATGGVQRLDGGEAGERRVAVVGSAPAVESGRPRHRLPGPEPIAPTVHLGLLVEVSIGNTVSSAGHRRSPESVPRSRSVASRRVGGPRGWSPGSIGSGTSR